MSKPAPYAAGGYEQSSRLQGVRALVVDDDAASAKLVSVLLAAEGCEVRAVHSAEEALETLATFAPRLIVIDLVLPLMSGLLLAQRLKAGPATRAAVLVAVTAFNGRPAERMARDAGFAAYVRKPLDPDSFGSLVVGALGGAG